MLLQTRYGGPGSDPDRAAGLNLGVFGVFLLAALTALITTLMWTGQLRRVSAAKSWPSVIGTVTASAVQPTRGPNGIADIIADVEYTVNGARHESMAEEVRFDVPTSAARPAPRSPIEVWFDPADPSRCTLIQSWQPRHTQRLLWILGPWSVIAVTGPILALRLRRAMHGELVGDE